MFWRPFEFGWGEVQQSRLHLPINRLACPCIRITAASVLAAGCRRNLARQEQLHQPRILFNLLPDYNTRATRISWPYFTPEPFHTRFLLPKLTCRDGGPIPLAGGVRFRW